MSLVESVKTCFKKYADFSGRARRSEYWWFILAYAVVDGVLTGLAQAFAGTAFGTVLSVVAALLGLACLVPNVAVTTRRLHDTGKSGWWQLISITVIGWIIILIWTLLDSDPNENKYGSCPK